MRRRTLLGLWAAAGPGLALAHGAKAGAVVIDHPYSPPTPNGARTAALYFRSLKNTGEQADRLLGARTPVAASVEIHRSTVEDGVMRMRAQPALELPPRSELLLRHGGELHRMLLDLKRPLVQGERFSVWLQFERAGEVEATAWVQQPRGGAPEHRH